MVTVFEFVRTRLLEAGDEGTPQSDLFRAIRASDDIDRRSRGTYASFSMAFQTLKRLNWVEATGVEEPSTTVTGIVGMLRPRVFYRLTQTGRDVPPPDWENPYTIRYPQFLDKSRYYVPTGRPRGRPRQPRRVELTPIPLVERPEVIIVPPEDVILPGEPLRRRMRIPMSTVIERRLRDLRPSVESLRDDPTNLDNIEADLLSIFDEAADAVDRTRGEERERVEALAQRLERAAEGFDRMRLGLATNNRVTYLEALEIVLACCTFD